MDEREYDWLEGPDALYSGAMTEEPVRMIFTAHTVAAGAIALAMVVAAVAYVLLFRAA